MHTLFTTSHYHSSTFKINCVIGCVTSVPDEHKCQEGRTPSLLSIMASPVSSTVIDMKLVLDGHLRAWVGSSSCGAGRAHQEWPRVSAEA